VQLINDAVVNSMALTLGQAAKEANVSKSTLSRAIKEGRLSAERKQDGGYQIEPVELFRVYPPKAVNPAEAVALDDEQSIKTTGFNELRVEIEGLRERLRDKDQHIDTLKGQVDDIQKDRDHWRTHAERATLVLEDMRQKDAAKVAAPPRKVAEPPKKKSWWQW
jgi:hypothetical protein